MKCRPAVLCHSLNQNVSLHHLTLPDFLSVAPSQLSATEDVGLEKSQIYSSFSFKYSVFSLKMLTVVLDKRNRREIEHLLGTISSSG